MKTRKQEHAPGLLETLRSLQFGIVVLIAIVVVAIAGTVLPQGESLEFYAVGYHPLVTALVRIFHLDNTYGSPLFLGLMGLFGLNLLLCTIHRFPGVLRNAFRPDRSPDREVIFSQPVHVSVPGASLDTVERAFQNAGFRMKRVSDARLFGEKEHLGHLGATVVHLSLLLLLIGGAMSLLTGKRGYIILHSGESTALATLQSGAKIPLGFTVRLDRFSVEYYEKIPDRPKSFTSAVTVTPSGGTPFAKEIRVNHPLIRNGLTVYQSSFGADDPEASAGNDTARVEVRLKGAPADMPPIATIDMATGGVYPVPGFGDTVQVRLAELQRNFRMGAPREKLNPAAKIDVLTRGTVRWSVYAFKNYPGLNMPMYEDIDLQFVMTNLLPDNSGAESAAGPRYYTVLGVVRDRGVPVVWTGALLMVVGLALSFYVRPRRIWAIEEDGTVHIGARSKGDPDSFRAFIEHTVERITPRTK